MNKMVNVAIFFCAAGLACPAAWCQKGDDSKKPVRPTVESVLLVDSSCLWLESPNQNPSILVGTLQWILKDGKWQCRAKDNQNNRTWSFNLNGPSLTIPFFSAWTDRTSDEQFTWFDNQVEAAIVNSVKDSIVTKEALQDVVQKELKQLVDEAVNKPEFVTMLAKEIRKQEDAAKGTTPKVADASSQPTDHK